MLITDAERLRLLQNGVVNAEAIERDGRTVDFMPVVKLFCPWGGATWLLTEIDPEDQDIAFGLCDLGMGCPEIGRVPLSALRALSGPGGLRIERDRYFVPTKTLSAYADDARQAQAITA